MNCREIDFILPELARGSASQGIDPSAALQHLEKCGRCRSLLEQERSLVEKLNFLAAATTLAASVEVEERLRAAFRRSATPAPGVTPALIRTASVWRLRAWAVGGSVAAALLLVLLLPKFGSGAFLGHRKNLPPRGNDSRVDQPASGKDATQAAGRLGLQPSRDATRRGAILEGHRTAASFRRISHGHGPRRASAMSDQVTQAGAVALGPGEDSAAQAQEQEITSDFFSLNYDAGSNAVDAGQLIRVKMPRSSLLSFGLPMNVERASEPIQADVLVGQDGRARAIRFVNFRR
ncbi:MAG TPA: hypothetical protein VGK99_04110 [Acidobacteriota bacterium]|jgi:hypothetical protein